MPVMANRLGMQPWLRSAYKANLNFADDESKKRNYKNIFVPTKCLKVTNIPTGKTGNEVAAFFRERGLNVRQSMLVPHHTINTAVSPRSNLPLKGKVYFGQIKYVF